MSRRMTKPTKWPVYPAKTQISLGIRPVWSESSLSAWRNIGPLTTYWAHSEDSDQTGQMPRLIWVFAGSTGHFVGFVMRQLKWYSSHKLISKTRANLSISEVSSVKSHQWSLISEKNTYHKGKETKAKATLCIFSHTRAFTVHTNKYNWKKLRYVCHVSKMHLCKISD